MDKARKLADHMIVIGDINLDQRVENDPLLRPEVRALQPIYDKICCSNGLKRLKNAPTRHAANSKSSLLDLVLSTDPQNTINIRNIKTGIADHDGVVFEMKCKDDSEAPQFYVSRNFNKINANNIIPLIDEDSDLQDLFADTD